VSKVWLVDDDDSIRWVLSRALTKADYIVDVFPDAESMLEALEKDTPNVVMTDIRMPGLSGLELADYYDGVHGFRQCLSKLQDRCI